MAKEGFNIGVGITVHNRYDVFLKTYNEFKKYLPKGSKLIIVDDASDVPVPEASFRFDQNVGIAAAKNKCIELLDDCENIFLFDDDTYPTSSDWWKPYVESKEPHLMYLFQDFAKNPRLNDCVQLYNDGIIKAYSHPRGCMLYLHNSVIKLVGGMNIAYGKWGNEHVDLSNRIFNKGLTSFRYADVVGSENLIHSGDEHEEVQTTVGALERQKCLTLSNNLLKQSFDSTEYIDYHQHVNDTTGQRNVILSSYFNNQVDTQRGVVWSDDLKSCDALINSCKDVELVILTNIENVKYPFETVTSSINPYFQRWLSYYQFLRDNPDIDYVFCVDATDVELNINPFNHINPDKIYCGDEESVLGSRWMLNYSSTLINYISANRTKRLLNAGVVGGSRENIMQIAHDIIREYFDSKNQLPNDMPAFNKVLYSKYGDKIKYGREVTNKFKSFDKTGRSWFFHK